jgi:hypothetical protein
MEDAAKPKEKQEVVQFQNVGGVPSPRFLK